MDEELNLLRSKLTRWQFERLAEYARDMPDPSPGDLLQETQDHVNRAREVYARNRLINLPLVTAIAGTIAQVVDRWDAVPTESRPWLAGAVMYFVRSDDDEPDFNSPIGFEDDTEVLNACLQLAKLDDLCLNVEDYDA